MMKVKVISVYCVFVYVQGVVIIILFVTYMNLYIYKNVTPIFRCTGVTQRLYEKIICI